MRNFKFMMGLSALFLGTTYAFALPSAAELRAKSPFSALKQEEVTWDLVKQTKYRTLPEITGPGTIESLWSLLAPDCLHPGGLFDAGSDAVTFLHAGDRMPEGRRKLIHSFGTSILVLWESTGDHPYTGIFADGAEAGILRLSLAKPESAGQSTPGFGLKLWRDNAESVNVLAMFSLDGQHEHNVFANSFTTSVGDPTPSFITNHLEKAFKGALKKIGDHTGKPTHLSQRHLAQAGKDGEKIPLNEVKEPYALIFEPTRSAKELMPTNDDFRAQLEGKAAGMVLYKVYAVETEEDMATRKSTLIGRVVAKNEGFTASAFADAKLFFRHYSPALDAPNAPHE